MCPQIHETKTITYHDSPSKLEGVPEGGGRV